MASSRVTLCLWIALVALGVLATFATVVTLEMDKAPLSARYVDYAIPAAISALRGLRDYTAYKEVAVHFIHHKDRPIAETIAVARETKINRPGDRWFISGDDKGLIDFVYFGFLLFGSSVLSIYLLAGLLFVVSVTMYVAEFVASPQKLLLLVAMLNGFYVVLFTFGITDQSGSVIEQRFLGALGLVPLLHVMLLIIDAKELSRWGVGRAILQMALICVAVHLRMSEFWQFQCVSVACVIVLLLRKSHPRNAIGALCLMLIMVIGLWTYRSATYNPEYFGQHVSSRVLWHNLVMGLSANHNLAERFALRPLDDVSVTEAVKDHLSKERRAELRQKLFRDPDYSVGNFAGFKWTAYEPAARGLYFHILRDHPTEVFKTYVWFMPKILIANISYMMGFALLDTELHGAGRLETTSQRDMRDHYLNPFRVIPMLLLLASSLLLSCSTSQRDKSTTASIGIVVVVSAGPPLLAMPVLQYSQILIVAALAACYGAAAMGLASLLRGRSATSARRDHNFD